MLVKEMFFKDLNKKQQEIIKRLSNCGENNLNYKQINSLFFLVILKKEVLIGIK